MSIEVKTDPGPINSKFFAAAMCGTATWLLWPPDYDFWQMYMLTPVIAAAGFASTIAGIRLLIKDYHNRKHIAESEKVSDDYGSARLATWEELKARVMDNPMSGIFAGLFEGKLPVFYPPDVVFSLIEMPPGVGKTVCLVLGSILHQAMLGKSLLIPDVKCELAPMLVKALRKLGFEVWCINPTRQHFDICGNTEINLYQSVLDAVYSDGDERKDAVQIARDKAELHLPEKTDHKNPYFGNGSRRCISTAILEKALCDPGNCTPTGVFKTLNDPAKFIKRLVYLRDHFEGFDPDDELVSFVKSEAANLLHRAKKNNDDNFGSFLEGATQPLLPFNQGGRLGGFGAGAIKNIIEMRQKQVIVFIMSPLSHKRDFQSLNSQINQDVLSACKRIPDGHPIHIVGEEALSYDYQDLTSDMETLRGLGITADFYIQSFAGLIKKMGVQAAKAIESYADVRIYGGLNSLERCRHVSDLLSESTIKKQDYSSAAVADKVNVSSKEMGRRIMTPTEILTMDKSQAWMFVRGLHPVKLTLAHYGQVSPWSDWVDKNPILGSRLPADPLFTIRYPKNKKEENSDD